MEGSVRFEELRVAYDRAFERLRGEVRMLGFAERRVREAELAYRSARNELAQFILEQQGEAVEELDEVSR
jgi:hypothetical protein